MASRFSQTVLALLLLLTACAPGDRSTFSCAVPASASARQIFRGTGTISYDTSPVKRLLISNGGDGVALCTGTALSARVVLTAAHCFYGVSNAQTITIEDIRPSGTVRYRADKFVVHPESYQPPAGADLDQLSQTAIDPGVDIALVITKTEMPAPYAKVADVPMSTTEALNILGYGDTNANGDLPGAVQLAPAYLSALFDQTTSKNTYSKSVIQTRPPSSGAIACQGDSGGPLVVAAQGFSALVGVTSGVNKLGCGQATRADFTRIVTFSSWINQTGGTFMTAYKAGECE